MRNYAWRGLGIILGLCIATLALLTSCGGGNGGGLDQPNAVSDAPAGGQAGATSKTITEDEVSSLPGWQQDLLADPGWNQPPIPQRADTPMPAPSYEQLQEWQAAAAAADAAAVGVARSGADGKGSSWVAGTPTSPADAPIDRGEYPALYPDQSQTPYGCLGTGQGHGHSKEKNIQNLTNPMGSPAAITYVLKGVSSPNHFNTTGGNTSDALCGVYQIWSSRRSANPAKQYKEYTPQELQGLEFAELGYRADGGPNASGADPECSAGAAAYTVKDFIWWRYNFAEFQALPNLNKTPMYNILIAPSSNATLPGVSSGNTTGTMQNFYCGTLSNIYGGGAIVSLSSSTSSCAAFAAAVPNNRFAYANPIYGVLLKRWQDSVLISMPNKNPWNGDFGWPVQMPTAFNNGAPTLTGNGSYYAWGQYFEKGFVWWIDYINNNNVPDEAQAYSYTGANVFCKTASDKYEKLPTIFYGGTPGQAPLGVSVIVEASLNPDRGATAPPAGTYYEVANPASPNPPLMLDVHAHGYGGTPRASDGRYKHYTWAFRDGTIGVTNAQPFDDSTKYYQHAYLKESVYTIRVQVIDANGKVGYGDSLPVHVGSGSGTGGGGSGQVWLVRADDATNDGTFGDYPAGYNALKTALTAKGVSIAEKDYSASVVADFKADSTSKVMIFYRGGPGAAGEPAPFTAQFPQAQMDQIKTLLNSGTKRRLLFVGQGQAYQNFNMGGNNAWARFFGATQLPANSTPANAVSDIQKWGDIVGTTRGWDVVNNTWRTVGSDTSESWPLQNYTVSGTISAGFVNSLSTNAAERYSNAGSSGKLPVCVSTSRQFTSGCEYDGFDTLGWWPVAKPGWKQGLHCTTNTGASQGFMPGYVHISHGSDTAPGTTSPGTGKIWCWEFSFADAQVTSPAGMTKADLLQNVLAWLDSSITFSAKTNGGFQEYSGNPEIVGVTPAYWDETNHNYVTGGQMPPWGGSGNPSMTYPDQTGTNMYRNTVGNPPRAVITTDYAGAPFNNNNDWINGNDVDFQQTMYAYINRGGNGTLELGGVSPSWNNTDDSVFYAGALASDADGSWTRIANPAQIPSIMSKEQELNTFGRNPMPVVCGYYQSSGSGSVADDVYSNYGTDMDAFSANLTSWSNNNPLTVECLARWPTTLKYFNWTGAGGQAPNAPDAYLVWQLYPGHGNTIPTGPNAGKFIGLNANWEESRREFDIETAGGWTVTGRSTSAWNRPAFSFQDPPTQGRAVSFNFRKLRTWNGDQNRDGALNTRDKFPVRVRLFTDHQTYYNKVVASNPASVFPNHLANPGMNPATTPLASRNPSYLECGTYVIDNGSPVYPLQVTDDENAPDPSALGYVNGQGPGTYTVRLRFKIKYGIPAYKVEADTAFNGTFGAGPIGNNGQNIPLVTIKDFPDAYGTEGVQDFTIQVPPNQPNGNYFMAIRVTDQDSPATVAQFQWPAQVPLFPSAFLQEDFNNLNAWTISTPQGFQITDQNWAALTSASTPLGTLSGFGGSGGFASCTPSSGIAYGDGHNKAITLTNAINIPANTAFTVSFYTAGYSESFWDGTIAEISKNNGSTWEGASLNYWGTAMYPSYIYGIYGYGGYGAADKYGFSGSSSLYGAGTSWVSHSATIPSQPTAMQFKMRFWFASDGSVNYVSPGICVDKLVVQ